MIYIMFGYALYIVSPDEELKLKYIVITFILLNMYILDIMYLDMIT